ncbi:type II secretion system minor pseudopilin GspJ [Porticoccus sp. W117]|uniref:type II secretion system minor pseudopilin GspJ n=1 Tax=Porticoccus sp. W117 TaxID=3054777 RepID=UPI002591EF0A|nr:type II secretion system minor pseudopilin GspJ [Porticoccus sp. W117]MDM3872565.1 type II secretion system minor pseudopilin GspJ [Porticoccus sp. W117]
MNNRTANHQQGFTLLEVMVALSIFSIIGIGSWQVLNQVLQSQETAKNRDAALADLQRGIWIMARDLRNVSNRPIRNEYHQIEPAISTLESGHSLTFTRSGWDNPTQQPRGHLQRVSYRINSTRTPQGNREFQLIRTYWDVLDRVSNSVPHEQVLIPGVSDMEIRFLDRDGIPRSHWPPSSLDQSDNNNSEGTKADSAEKKLPQHPLPLGITVRLVTEQFGEITRTFALAERERK